MDWRLGLWLGALHAAALLSCDGPDDEQAWGLNESRTLMAGLESLTSAAGTGTFRASVPLGIQRYRLIAAAEDTVKVGAGATLTYAGLPDRFAAVSAVGGVSIGSGARVGPVYSLLRAPRIEPGGRVYGYVKSRARLTQLDAASVQLGVMQVPDVRAEVFEWHVDLDPGPHPDRTARAAPAPALTLEPASYGALRIPARASAVLGVGAYRFTSLTLDEGGVLRIDNACGPVYIWVRDELVVAGSIVEQSLDPNVLLGYAGTRPPSIRAAFRGTLVAPATTLHLPATERPHSGAFFARTIDIAREASLELRGFMVDQGHVPDAAITCAECASASRRVARECCDEAHQERLLSARFANRPEPNTPEQATAECVRTVANEYAACLLRSRLASDFCARSAHPAHGAVSCE